MIAGRWRGSAQLTKVMSVVGGGGWGGWSALSKVMSPRRWGQYLQKPWVRGDGGGGGVSTYESRRCRWWWGRRPCSWGQAWPVGRVRRRPPHDPDRPKPWAPPGGSYDVTVRLEGGSLGCGPLTRCRTVNPAWPELVWFPTSASDMEIIK